MSLIADSDAVLEIQRILPQHQSAITLLNLKLQNPSLGVFNWIDLACGKGQIISQLADNLSEISRKKLSYIGYDISVENTRVAQKIAKDLALNHLNFIHGDICDFSKLVIDIDSFDFITCTNTAHELQPGAFANLIIDCILRLSERGELFVYDMESLDTPELGALPWKGSEIAELINEIFSELGLEYKINPSIWHHKTCNGWTITIQREYIQKTNDEIKAAKPALLNKIDEKINYILDTRFNECNKMLQAYCKYGVDTIGEEKSKLNALYEFWAIFNAKELRK
jgi:SAM-dependent methyltransferase